MELHTKLKVLRKLKGLTQQNISDQFYISRQAVQRWESGETSPDITKLRELAELFDVTVDDLLNPELKEKELLKKALDESKRILKSNTDIMSIIKKASTIDWILFSTIIFGTVIIVLLLHLLGTIIVILSFLTSLSFFAIGAYSIFNIAIFVGHGIPPLIIYIALSLIGLSSSYISYYFFILFINTYINLVKKITLRFRDYGVLKGMIFYE